MLNDEVNNKAITLELRIGKLSAKEVLKAMKAVSFKAGKLGLTLAVYIYRQARGHSKPLGKLVNKGQLEDIEISKGKLKELKKEMNRLGVDFSVVKDKKTGLYSVFFQAKNANVMDIAFKRAIEKFNKKEVRKESTRKILKKFKEVVKNMVKDILKNKHHDKER